MAKQMITVFGFYALLATVTNGCKKYEAPASDKSVETTARAVNTAGFVTNPVNLNVVYFIPTDNPAPSDYKTRVSEYLIYFQNWVKSEMNRNGFGEKTFGLPLDSATNKVRLITINAQEGQASYPYSASVSAAKIINEINVYKASHPSEFSSNNHTLILLPKRTDVFDQPYYGWGKNCFAVDHAGLSVANLGNASQVSTLMGGMLHELGHGLNLPHDEEKYTSEKPILGTSLMGSGNSTFGYSATFLSYGDCAILDKNEVFQPASGGAFYTGSSANIVLKQFDVNATAGTITISGKYTSSHTAAHALLYFDPVTTNNTDHNSVQWAVPTINSDSFRVVCNINDFRIKGTIDYNLNIRLILANGNLHTKSYAFKFVSDVPKIVDTLVLYQNCSYGGYKVSLPFGSYTTAELIAKGLTDNDASSVSLPIGTTAVLFDGDNFSGTTVTLADGSSSCLQSNGFNDKLSSLIFVPAKSSTSSTVNFYKHCSYGGYNIALGIGGYTTADLVAAGITDNDISSLKVPADLKVTLYDDDNYRGTTYTATGAVNVSCLPSGFNDKASSLIISKK